MQTLYDTRTKSEDYRIYSDGGRRVFSSSEFQPFYKKAEIDETEECAILYEEQGKIYLVVFMLKRDAKDVATRGLSFSFCQIFLQSELSNALRAFTRIKEEWIAAEAKVSEL
ncbi:MAG: hypothetical protein IJU48_04675 [Synergistaceae bacterium]|nr:hypothetical protein [Synergistaceae bacterium]